jgi:hypothetical protein
VFAQVVISEIAWMGTHVSANDEWIELHNIGPSAANLEGWRLVSVDGSPDIDLAGVLESGEYGILERSDDQSVPGVSAFGIYSGSLGNAGEHLKLLNADGNISDQIKNSQGWFAGDNTTKETMQKNNTGWISGVATPGYAYDGDEKGVAENSNANNDVSGGGMNDDVADNVSVHKRDQDPRFRAEIQVPNRVTVGNPAHFFGKVTKQNRDQFRGVYVWNFGDGEVHRAVKNISKDFLVDHAYEYPGKYTVVFEYYADHFAIGNPLIHLERIIHVQESGISVDFDARGSFMIRNKSSHVIDMSNWKIMSSDYSFVVPKNSIIQPSQSFRILSYRSQFQLSPKKFISVQTGEGQYLAYYIPEKETPKITKFQPSLESEGDLDVGSYVSVNKIKQDIVQPERSVVIHDNHRSSSRVGIAVVTGVGVILILGMVILFQDGRFDNYLKVIQKPPE